jgi:4-amino-4-deoxy-L-arabinose transferase-like glycosyltransferase
MVLGNRNNTSTRVIVFILLAIMALACILSLRMKSPTVDEFAHLPAGYYYWKTGDFSLYGKNPPLIRLLGALPLLAMDITIDPTRYYAESGDWRPWVFGTDFMRKNATNYSTIFFFGRIPMVLLGLLLGFYVFQWSKELYGTKGGILSLVLFTFSPNMLAHARLVTTDMGFTCFAFIATYYYWRSFRSDKKKVWIAAGVFVGLALLSKFTALLLLPVFGLLLLLVAWQSSIKDALQGLSTTTKPQPPFPQCLGKGALRLGLMILIAVFVVNAGYGFKGSLTTLDSTSFNSQLFRTLDKPPLNKVPVPLPSEFVQGFDRQKLDAEQGVFLNYLRGKLSNKGWWYYFFYAFLLKTPIPLLLGFLFCLWHGFRCRQSGLDQAFLIVPALVILAIFSFFNEINVGLRYILPVFPFLFVWMGQLGELSIKKPVARWIAGTLLVTYVFSSLSAFPDYLAYFNAWAGGSENGHRHLLDSNLDWGQDLKRLKTYMEKEGIEEVGLAYFGHVDPAVYGIDYHTISETPESDDIAISANYLYGLPYLITYDSPPKPIKPGTFNWLRKYKPQACIGNTIYVFSLH